MLWEFLPPSPTHAVFPRFQSPSTLNSITSSFNSTVTTKKFPYFHHAPHTFWHATHNFWHVPHTLWHAPHTFLYLCQVLPQPPSFKGQQTFWYGNGALSSIPASKTIWICYNLLTTIEDVISMALHSSPKKLWITRTPTLIDNISTFNTIIPIKLTTKHLNWELSSWLPTHTP